jgi:hypothetical protein
MARCRRRREGRPLIESLNRDEGIDRATATNDRKTWPHCTRANNAPINHFIGQPKRAVARKVAVDRDGRRVTIAVY